MREHCSVLLSFARVRRGAGQIVYFLAGGFTSLDVNFSGGFRKSKLLTTPRGGFSTSNFIVVSVPIINIFIGPFLSSDFNRLFSLFSY